MIADLPSLLILIGFMMGWGVIGVIAVQFMRGRNLAGIAELYETATGGVPVQLTRLRLDANQESCVWGEHQFVLAKEFIVRYTKWNRWGGRVPTYRFEKAAGRPNSEASADIAAFKQKAEKAFVDPKPSSASVNLILRRKGLQQMMNSTKSVAMDPKVIGVLCLGVGLAIGFMVFMLWHPGMTAAPPDGYSYILQRVTSTSTVHAP